MYDMQTAAQAIGSLQWPTVTIPDELYTVPGATLLLGLKFNDSAPTKTGTYNITTVVAPTYATTGGVQNTGYLIPNASPGGAFGINEHVASTAACFNKTYMAWYRGTQTVSISGSPYSPSVPIFSDTGNNVYWGFGISSGKIEIANGVHNLGTTFVNTNQWFHLAWTVTTGGTAIGYVNGVQEVSTSVNTSYPGGTYIAGGYNYSGVQTPTAIDAVQIYNGILTATQIRSVYLSGIA